MSELITRLNELLDPAKPTDSAGFMEEQDRLLSEFRNQAVVIHRQNIETATMEISNALLMNLHTMAKDRSLSPLSSGMSYRTENGIVYFHFALKFAEGEPLSSDACHWIRITGENKSYVEASFGFTNDPRPHSFPSAYYCVSISDITRLQSAVESKANEIFAGLLQRLREKHS